MRTGSSSKKCFKFHESGFKRNLKREMKEFIVVVALLVMLVCGRPQFGGEPTESSGTTTVFGNRRPSSTLPTSGPSSSKPSSPGSSGGVSSGPSSSGKLLH